MRWRRRILPHRLSEYGNLPGSARRKAAASGWTCSLFTMPSTGGRLPRRFPIWNRGVEYAFIAASVERRFGNVAGAWSG